MKNWNDVIYTAEQELSAWFTKQTRNISTRYYWKYTETKPNAPGKIWIESEDHDEIDGYYLHSLSTGNTKEIELGKFLKIAGKLPILEY